MSAKDTAIDIVEITAKTILSTIPVGGALVSAVWDVVKGNCISKRSEEWKATLEQRLSKLENTLEEVGDNELFTTALIKATELATKTARQEKMELLANAVIHSVNQNINEDKLIVFLNLLDRYTISHIKILYFFSDPKRFKETASTTYMMGTPKIPLFSVYPELDTPMFDMIYNNLYSDGLVNTNGLNVMMSGTGMLEKRTTELGDEFLAYILGQNLDECDALRKEN